MTPEQHLKAIEDLFIDLDARTIGMVAFIRAVRNVLRAWRGYS